MRRLYLPVLRPKIGGLDGHHALFAAEVPFLPDWIRGEVFAGTSRAERVAEIIQRQIQFISALAHLPSDHTALDLRFVYRSSRHGLGALRVGFLGRGSGPSEADAQDQAHKVWQTLRWVIPPEYPLNPVLDDQRDASTRFDSLYTPFEPKNLAEIRKGERYLHDHPLKYLPCPFYPRPDSMIQVCRALLHYNRDCLISICLVPTTLQDTEIQVLEERLATIRQYALSYPEQAARVAVEDMQDITDDIIESAETPTFHPFALQPPMDMLSMAGAHVYERLLRAPHLLAVKVQIASNEPIPDGIIHTLGADLSTPSAIDRDSLYFSDYKVLRPADDAQSRLARWDLQYLALTRPRWHPTPPDQESPFDLLRHLASPEEASAAFRLPVIQDNAWIGIPTRTVNPFYPTPVYSSLLRERQTAVAPATPATSAVSSPSRIELHLGTIVEEPERRERSYSYPIPIKDLVKHALIVGVTGSGKTTTCLYLLKQLWPFVPFLVIEPAKSEYRSLLRQKPNEAKDLLVFTVGDDETGKLRFDPFRVPVGVSVATHISLLVSCFAAAFPMGGVLEILLTRAFREAYRDLYGPDDGQILHSDDTRPPTPPGFLKTIAAKAAYHLQYYQGEVQGNLKGALTNRLEWLQDSVIGRTINPQSEEQYIEIEDLLQKPTVIELRRLADNNEKALLMALLLAMIAEYYEYTLPELGADAPKQGVEGLRHVTLVEEAHRLLAHVPLTLNPEVANSKGKAIELFIEMLAELRSRGEGILIAEQIPTKLISDAIKNTNLKIVHRITPEDDRLVLGATMNLDEKQRQFITLLQPGQAAVFQEEFEAAVLVQVPDCRMHWADQYREVSIEQGIQLDDAEALYQISSISDTQVREHMQILVEQGFVGTGIFRGWSEEVCQHCWHQCLYRQDIPLERYTKVKWDKQLPDLMNKRQWEDLEKSIEEFLGKLGVSRIERGHIYCYLAYLAHLAEKNRESSIMQDALRRFGQIDQKGRN